jgi:hypothetical protein
LPTRSTPVPAFSFPPQEGTATGFITSTDGLEFVPWVDIEVSALGYYDDAGDGLLTAHRVAVFDSDTKKTVTPVVIVDSESPLDGSYRYEPITPVVLKEGKTYMVAGDSRPPFDKAVDKPDGLAWAPEIQFVQYHIREGGWGYPASHQGYVWTEPNFKFMPVSAVSPSPAP